MTRSLLSSLIRFYHNAREYRGRRWAPAYPPIRLWIEPTNICNLRCIMCPTGRGKASAPGRMDLGLYAKVIDEAATFAIDINLIGRGEAFLHPDIAEMVRYAHERGLNVRIESNATMLTPEKSEAVIRAGLDFISFSMDGYTKEVYESIRRGANFEATIENIRAFLAAKKRLRSRKPYASIQFIQTIPFVNGATAGAEREFKRIFRGLPLDTYRYVTPHRYVGEIEESITGSRYGYMKRTKLGKGLVKLNYTPCPYPWFSMHVLWNGTVSPCCMDFYARYVVGNAGSSSLRELWNGAPLRVLREALALGRYREIPLCAHCDLLYQTEIGGVSTKNIRDFKIFLKENIFR